MNWRVTLNNYAKSDDTEGARMTSMTTADLEQLVLDTLADRDN